MRKWIAGLTAFMLAISPLASYQAYGASLGDPLYSKSLVFNEGTILANGVYWSSQAGDKITENYIEYSPGGTVIPIISHGNDVYGAASFRAVTAKEKSKGVYVLAGVNGDFFEMSTGIPIGMTIENGILKTSESFLYNSVGFYGDGRAVIGKANMNIRLDGPTLKEGIGQLHLNKKLTTVSGVVLYTVDFADDDTNKVNIPSYNILLNVNSGVPCINGIMDTTVDSVFESQGSVKIPEGKVLISMAKDTAYKNTLDRLMLLNPGDGVAVTFQADEIWNDVSYAIGGGDKLLQSGKNVAPQTKEVNPHTAFGIKGDGSILFYTVDGRQTGHSRGCTLSQLADRLLELGCREAINLDGGGSTAIYTVYPGDNTLSLLNSPAQTPQRSCANYILLINTAEPAGDVSNLHLYPFSVNMLAGASCTFTVKATDKHYYQIQTPAVLDFSTSGNIGTVDEKGVFRAGNGEAVGEVYAKSGGRAYGSAKVSVITKPDSIAVIEESSGKPISNISVNGGESFDLSVQGTYNRMPLVVSDDCFSWSVQGDIGNIDARGLFTAANISEGSGSIKVTAGGASVSVPVKITSDGIVIETFEGSTHKLQGEGIPGLTAGVNKDLTSVRYGYQSGFFTYDFARAGGDVITLPTNIAFERSPGNLNLWVYGDGSGNTLGIKCTAKGKAEEIIAARLDFSGWKQFVVSLPEGTSKIDGLQFVKTGNAEGTVYLDHLMGGFGYYVDDQPPVIKLAVEGGTVTATINDLMDSLISNDRIRLTYDGVPLQFNYDANTKKLSASLPEADGKTHRISITAEDLSGNLERKGLTVSGQNQVQPFLDMNGHWASVSTGYLYDKEIVSGIKTAKGLTYNPERSLTRAEFAVLMAKWLSKDQTRYSGINLPFEDSSQIPSWAMDAVKAMYGMNIIQGTAAGGKLYFRPEGSISREEVMTIIGRTQARGYKESDLSAFSDKSQVSAWALPYVKTLVHQEIISGYSGKLWPKDSVTRAQAAVMIMSLF